MAGLRSGFYLEIMMPKKPPVYFNCAICSIPFVTTWKQRKAGHGVCGISCRGKYATSKRKNTNQGIVYKLKPIKERFWDNVTKIDDDNSCWEWTGNIDVYGYGKLFCNGKKKIASRLSWEINVGEIPAGRLICHKCDNPKCVRPDHLFLGTHKDNTQDALKKSRLRQGESHSSSKFKEIDIITIRRLFKNGNHSQIELAKIYSTTQQYISSIVTRRKWKHI